MSAREGHIRLADVLFCVLDLETTGTSDDVDEIVEVGAVLVRGGQQLGTFQTMVRHPLAAGPSDVPNLGSVLASLLEFMRGAVIVGHNIRFDLRFLNAALWKCGHDVVLDPADAIDTMPLARRLLRDDADDCRLGTLALRFQFEQQPTHRALADAAATVELLHLLIERATHYGALDLDDLMQLPLLMRHRYRAKLAITAHVPRAPGVACLFNRSSDVITIVAADDLRDGVRGLFHESSHVAPGVLQHLHGITTVATQHPLVAQLVSLRWAAAHATLRRSSMVYLQLRADRRTLRVVTDRDLPGVVAGPIQRAAARLVVARVAAMSPASADRFVAAISDGSIDTLGDALDLDDPMLRQLVEQHCALAAARAHRGTIDIADGTVEVDDGRVVDIVTHQRSWRDVLPPPIGDDRPGRPPSVPRATEAMFVAQLLADEGVGPTSAQIRDVWSPQY